MQTSLSLCNVSGCHSENYITALPLRFLVVLTNLRIPFAVQFHNLPFPKSVFLSCYLPSFASLKPVLFSFLAPHTSIFLSYLFFPQKLPSSRLTTFRCWNEPKPRFRTTNPSNLGQHLHPGSAFSDQVQSKWFSNSALSRRNSLLCPI